MIAAEKTDGAVPKPASDGSLVTVKVYTRHTHIARSETGRTGQMPLRQMAVYLP